MVFVLPRRSAPTWEPNILSPPVHLGRLPVTLAAASDQTTVLSPPALVRSSIRPVKVMYLLWHHSFRTAGNIHLVILRLSEHPPNPACFSLWLQCSLTIDLLRIMYLMHGLALHVVDHFSKPFQLGSALSYAFGVHVSRSCACCFVYRFIPSPLFGGQAFQPSNAT